MWEVGKELFTPKRQSLREGRKREKAENWVWEVGKELYSPKNQPVRGGRDAKGRRIGCGMAENHYPHPKTLWLKEN